MKVPVYTVKGEKAGEIDLPSVFSEPVREDLIRRAVIAAQSHRLQPKGTKPKAGRGYTAEYVGVRRIPFHHRTINVGRARLPRTKNFRYLIQGWVANVPQAVGGPRAHPPKVEKNLREEINKKERRKAIRSAIAATADENLVRLRGHVFSTSPLPIVVEDDVEALKSVRDVKEMLRALGVWEDVERAKEKTRRRAGKGERRGRAYKTPKSVLIVVKENRGIYRAARNLPGVDVVEVRNLNAELLAPGGHPGRLTIWSKSAIEALNGLFVVGGWQR